MYCRKSAKKGVVRLGFHLTEGKEVNLYHKTGFMVRKADLSKFTTEGELKPRVVAFNKQLKSDIGKHIVAMHKAYARMQVLGLDMHSKVFEKEIEAVLGSEGTARTPSGETMYERYLRYIEEAYRDNVIGKDRHDQYMSKAKRLKRFLTIQGLSKISAQDFDVNLLLEFRRFVFDEYLYVPKYKSLYSKKERHRWPTKRLGPNTVVTEMKALKAFFNELETTDEITKSPFCHLSNEKRRSMMHTMYDDPYFLRAEEFQKVIATEVTSKLQKTKDIFILNCATGCRISDLKSLTMDKVAVSAEGIPYIHYIPAKTKGRQETNREIKTPLIHIAFDIVMRTRFNFNKGCSRYEIQQYNKELHNLLEYCGIYREISVYDHEKKDNIYVPLYKIATSRLARKTHVDMMNKVQVNWYAAGLHKEGSDAVHRYTTLEMKDRFALLNAAFDQQPFTVDENFNIIRETASPRLVQAS